MNAPANRTFFSFKRLTLQPLATQTVRVTGSYFICTDASGNFEMAFNAGEWFPWQAGLALRFSAGDFFTELHFRNPSGNTVVALNVFTGVGEIVDNRLNIVRERALQVLSVDSPTLLLPSATTSLAGGADLVLLGDAGAVPLQRRSVQVENQSATLPLQLWSYGTDGTDGALVKTIAAGATYTLDTSDKVVITNPAAETAVALAVTEIYYSLATVSSGDTDTPGVPTGEPLGGAWPSPIPPPAPAPDPDPDPTIPHPDDLAAYYKLDEANGLDQFEDSVGVAHLANLYDGDVTFAAAPGLIVGAAQQQISTMVPEDLLDATDDVFKLDTLATGFTFRLWYKLAGAETTDQPAYLAVIGAVAHWASSDLLLYKNSGNWRLRLCYDTSHEPSIAIPADTDWHCLHAWYDVATKIAYLALDDGTPAFANPVDDADWWSDATIFLGTLGGDGVPGLLIDEVAFWRERILTSEERTTDYNAGAGVTYTP